MEIALGWLCTSQNHGSKQEAGTDRPNLESAWRIEGDLQLMIASFAEKKKLKGNSAGQGKRRDSSSIECWEACGYSVPVVVVLSLSVRAAGRLAVL
jgi:hypothetical protein